MKKHRSIQAVLLASVIGVVSMPQVIAADVSEAATSANIQTWIGYQLRDAAGKYLTVANGAAESGTQVLPYAANGVASYNIWYFTETSTGMYTLKSSLSQGEYYLTVVNGGLQLDLEQEGLPQYLTCTDEGRNRIRLQQNGVDFGVYTLEPVTWLQAGDVNRDGSINVVDLMLAKRIVLEGSGTDFCAAALADVNGDGTSDANDISALQAFLLQRQTTLPATEVTLPENTIFPTVIPDLTTETTTTTVSDLQTTTTTTITTEVPQEVLTLADMPESYQYAADWIWQNRVEKEQSTARRNTIFDQIIAGNGELHYVIRWQSYKTVTLEQRKQFETLVEDSINEIGRAHV